MYSDRIVFDESRDIREEVPILCECIDTLYLSGTGKDIVVNLYAGEQQPCIGNATHTNMSYGRWSSNLGKLKKIVVDNVKVVCYSKVPNFSLGSYNYSFVPEIVLLNGGELVCPETTGTRIQTNIAEPPSGSTKISAIPTYVIQKENEPLVFSKEQQEVIEEATALCLDTHYYTQSMSSSYMQKVLKYQKFGLDLNKVSDVISEGKYGKNIGHYLNAVWHNVNPHEKRLLDAMSCMSSMGILSEFTVWQLEVSAFLDVPVAEIDKWSDAEIHARLKSVVERDWDFNRLTDKDVSYLYELITPMQFLYTTVPGTEEEILKRYFANGHV